MVTSLNTEDYKERIFYTTYSWSLVNIFGKCFILIRASCKMKKIDFQNEMKIKKNKR